MFVDYVADVTRLASRITLKKGFNFLKLKQSYFFSIITGKPVHRGAPVFLSVEPTTSCNLHCPQCFRSQSSFTRPRGNMTENNMQKILEEFSGHAFYLNLYFQGEPFLNPELTKFISMAKQFGFYVVVSTNGHFLDEMMSHKLISSGLDRLIVSLDGTDAATYQEYRKNGSFDKVISGIQTLVAVKKKMKKKYPFIELQFVLTRKNQHQRHEVKKFGKKLSVGRTAVKSMQLNNFNEAGDWLPDRSSRYKKDEHESIILNSRFPNRCFRLWSSCVVTWDGNVIPCCFDKNAADSMGNIYTQGLQEIWHNEAYDVFRRKVFSERKNIDICCNCIEGILK